MCSRSLSFSFRRRPRKDSACRVRFRALPFPSVHAEAKSMKDGAHRDGEELCRATGRGPRDAKRTAHIFLMGTISTKHGERSEQKTTSKAFRNSLPWLLARDADTGSLLRLRCVRIFRSSAEKKRAEEAPEASETANDRLRIEEPSVSIASRAVALPTSSSSDLRPSSTSPLPLAK